MQQRRDRWTLRAGMLLLPALYLALAGVHAGTETRLPLWQEAMAQAPAVARNAEAPGVSSPLHQVTLRITGISWGAWARIVQLVLARLDGVRKVDVSFAQQRAQVAYLPDKITVQQMIDAVKQAGFGAEVVQERG